LWFLHDFWHIIEMYVREGFWGSKLPFFEKFFFNLLGFFKKKPQTPLNFPVHSRKFQNPSLEKFLDTLLCGRYGCGQKWSHVSWLPSFMKDLLSSINKFTYACIYMLYVVLWYFLFFNFKWKQKEQKYSTEEDEKMKRWKATLRHENISTKGNGIAGKKDTSIKKKTGKKTFLLCTVQMDNHK